MTTMRSTRDRENPSFLWGEECVFVKKLRRVDRGKGKTGKGLLHVFAPNYRCFDVEDIIGIGPKVRVPGS